MSAVKSACGEYECPCHDALPVERARVERMRKALNEIVKRLRTTPKHDCAGYLCSRCRPVDTAELAFDALEREMNQ